MSGELTLSQFRYTTTNNRDLVIGDPTNTAELLDPKYIVFQTNTAPGYATNPYIGVTYNSGTSTWELQFSSNGVSSTSFAQLSLANIFSAANTFNSTVTFNGSVALNSAVTFSSSIAVSGAATFNGSVIINNSSPTVFNSPVTISGSLGVSGAVTLSSTLLLSGAGTFNGLVTLSDGLTATGAISLGPISSVISNSSTVAVHYTGSTSASSGSGLVVYGSSAIIASILTSTTTTTSDTWTLLPASGYPINFISDSSYPITFKSPGLTAARTYQYPNNSGILVINPGTFSGSKLLLSSSDNTSITESTINVSYLSGLTSNIQSQINLILANAGGAVVGTTGTFSGALSATSLALSGAITGATAGTFSSALTAASLTLSDGISAGGTVMASSFSGAGTGLTGTASSLSVGYASSAGSAGTVPYSGVSGKPFTTVSVYNSSSRPFSTSFTNSTSGPMFVTVTVQPQSSQPNSAYFYVYLNGTLSAVSCKSTGIDAFDDTATCSFIVPQGWTYQVNLVYSISIANVYWSETHN
jgi:hypothetical protein